MGGHHILQRRPKAGPVALGSNRGLAIPVQRKAPRLGPVCRAQIAKPGHGCLSLQRAQDIGRALIQRHLLRGISRHKPGKTAVPEIFQQQKAMAQVLRQTARGRQAKLPQMRGHPQEHLGIIPLAGWCIHQDRRFSPLGQPVITAV